MHLPLLSLLLLPAAPPSFIAHPTDAVLPPAPLLRLTDGWTAELAGAIPAGNLIELRRQSKPRPALPRRSFVQLSHGDCIPLEEGAPVKLIDGRLSLMPARSLQPAEAREISLYRPYASLLLLTLPDDIDDADAFLARLRRETRPRDVVYLRSGDRLEGTVTLLDPDHGCAVTDEGRKLHAAWQNLAGIAWNTERQARPRPRSPWGHAVLADGARLNFTQLHFDSDAKRWTGRTWFGDHFECAAERLIALDIWHGPAVYLSDLPARYEHTPYLGVSWPLALNSAVTGAPLALGPDIFDKGLGVHSASRVSYALDRQYRWFETVVGLDDRAGERGRARLSVFVDGKHHDIGAREVGRREGARSLRINVEGARELTLLTECGAFGDVQAHVDWCNARLVK